MDTSVRVEILINKQNNLCYKYIATEDLRVD